jgi:hypothetical protein
MTRSLAILAAILLGGCDLYWGDDDDCRWGWGAVPEPALAAEYRNPETGLCEGFGGGYPCDDRCGGPCPAIGLAPPPDWGSCFSHCEGLDAATCMATDGCFTAYRDNPYTDGPSEYLGCWQTAPSGPVGGSCANLDAYQCSRHDNCVAYYSGTHTYDTTFASCQPEPAAITCDLVDCGAGYTCAEVCTSGPNGTCYATCVPAGNDPGSCTGPVNCFTGQPACPSGTTAGIKDGCWTGYCIPLSQCGPSNPGECTGDVLCRALPPECPTGTVPGIANGCWTGFCIPESHCPMVACEQLATEQACVARGDCVPLYEGSDCTCTPTTCTCNVLTYESCFTK